MNKQSKILVTGASGLIGNALVRLLRAEGYENVMAPTHDELDLLAQQQVYNYFVDQKPEYVFHLAAYVGGVKDNSDIPVKFIYGNTIMHCNVLSETAHSGVKKLLFPGSACAYPAITDRPIREDDFLQGMPEPTNLAYAVAKQNGIVMAQSYAKQYGMKVVLPMVANTYGPGDRSSHVIPMVFEKMRHTIGTGEIPVLWGSGEPLREFIHADDVASALLFLMLNYDSLEIINVGTQEEISIKDLAIRMAKFWNYDGAIAFDATKPDGVMRKCLDSSKLRAMGWTPKITLDEGIRKMAVDN